MTTYNLESSMFDRVNFDQVQREYIIAMLENLPEKLALTENPEEFAELGWEAFEIDLENEAVIVDDLEEAKARFFKVAIETVKDWQNENS